MMRMEAHGLPRRTYRLIKNHPTRRDRKSMDSLYRSVRPPCYVLEQCHAGEVLITAKFAHRARAYTSRTVEIKTLRTCVQVLLVQ